MNNVYLFTIVAGFVSGFVAHYLFKLGKKAGVETGRNEILEENVKRAECKFNRYRKDDLISIDCN